MRIAIGTLIWLLLLGGGGGTLLVNWNRPDLKPLRRLVRYFGERAVTFTAVLSDRVEAKPYTHVLVEDPELFLRRIGTVKAVSHAQGKTRLTIEIFPEDARRFRSGVEATYFTVPGSAAWIVKTLIPAERVQHIRSLWKEFYAGEREAIAGTLWPVVKESVQEIFEFYETEVPRVIRENRPELDALAARHRHGAFEKEFMPSVRAVVWDFAQKRFEPLLKEVGRQLWDRLPVWGLTWRYLYENVPFTRDDHVTNRFNQFLTSDALPLIKARSAEVLRLVGEIFRDTVRDPRVAESLRKVVGEVAADPETVRLIKKLSAELILKNDRLKALVRKRWEENGLKEAVSAVGGRFEPFVHDAVNSIVLSEDGLKMHPRLSRVLRSRVLKKDGAWVLLRAAGETRLEPGAVISGKIDAGR
jgi:hypothetical protein